MFRVFFSAHPSGPIKIGALRAPAKMLPWLRLVRLLIAACLLLLGLEPSQQCALLSRSTSAVWEFDVLTMCGAMTPYGVPPGCLRPKKNSTERTRSLPLLPLRNANATRPSLAL